MRLLSIALAAAIAASGAAMARAETALPVIPPRAGPFPTTVFAQGGRERVTYSLDRDGGYVKGVDTVTGARWSAEVSASGEIKGKDVDGNRWRYDLQTRVYYNLGAGRSCTATSIRRVCPS